MKKEFVNLPRTYPSPSHNNYAQTEFQFAIPSTPPARSNYHKANPRNDSAPRNTYSRYPPREQEIVTVSQYFFFNLVIQPNTRILCRSIMKNIEF